MLGLQFVEKFRYSELQEFAPGFTKDPYPEWLARVFGRSRNLRTLVIDSCKLGTMKYIFSILSPQLFHAPGSPPRCGSLLCPALSTIILEVPYDGRWHDWVVPFIQMLQDRAAVGFRLGKVRIVANPRVQIPRPGEERRRQMSRFVPWVEVKFFWYNNGVLDERRVRELYEWEHDEEGFPDGEIKMTGE